MKKVTIYGDGGSRGNPGHAGSGAAIYIDNELVLEKTRFIGIGTNNEAEYISVIIGLEGLSELDIEQKEIIMYMDSKLVVQQLNGDWKIKKPHLRKLADEAFELIEALNISVKFVYIPREENGVADALANRAMDEK